MNIQREDLKVLKDLVWWTACKTTPYLVKGGVVNDNYYIAVSDLKSTWFRKADKETILAEKQSFNKALQVNNFEGLIEILVKPMTAFDKHAAYTFNRLDGGNSLNFEFQTIINIYPFTWRFFMHKIPNDQHFQVLTDDIINPLLCTVKANELRINLLKKNFAELEQNYMKKLTDREKMMYKSKLDDTEDFWRSYVHDVPLDTKVDNFELSDASNYLFRSFSKMRIRKIEEQEGRVEREEKESKKRKADKMMPSQSNSQKASYTEEYVENVEEINKKIEKETIIKEKEEKKAKKAKMSFL